MQVLCRVLNEGTGQSTLDEVWHSVNPWAQTLVRGAIVHCRGHEGAAIAPPALETLCQQDPSPHPAQLIDHGFLASFIKAKSLPG